MSSCEPANSLGQAICGWQFTPTHADKQVALAAGERVWVLEKASPQWWTVQKLDSADKGYAPANFFKEVAPLPPSSAAMPSVASEHSKPTNATDASASAVDVGVHSAKAQDSDPFSMPAEQEDADDPWESDDDSTSAAGSNPFSLSASAAIGQDVQQQGSLAATSACSSDGLANLSGEELADPLCPARRSMNVVRTGFLSKKGGTTTFDEDGTAVKTRNFEKGGRRNWQQRWFVLLDSGHLLYYKTQAEKVDEYRGSFLCMGSVTLNILSSNTDFALYTAESATNSKPALLLRAANETARGYWQTDLQRVNPSLRIITHADPGAAAQLDTDMPLVSIAPAPAPAILTAVDGSTAPAGSGGNETDTSHDLLRRAHGVLKAGWLEKKGGVTKVTEDGELIKERNFSKGGRRNWSKRWFVLLESGDLFWYESDVIETEAGLKGHIKLCGSTVHLLSKNSLIIAPAGSNVDGAEDGKEALLVRSEDSYEISLYLHYFEVVDPSLVIKNRSTAGDS